MFWCNTSNLPQHPAGNVFKFVDLFEQKLSLSTQKKVSDCDWHTVVYYQIEEAKLNYSYYKSPTIPVFLYVLATLLQII